MKKRITSIVMFVMVFMANNLSAQISNYFSSENDLIGFKGAQSEPFNRKWQVKDANNRGLVGSCQL